MPKKKTYWEKLKDPRWQKKRLEILDRSDWECEWCGSKEDQLQIHHGYYRRNADPWDYPNHTLHCLCEKCHKNAQKDLDDLWKHIGDLDLFNVAMVIGYVKVLALFQNGEEDNSIELHNGDEIVGAGHAAYSSDHEIFNIMLPGGIIKYKSLHDLRKSGMKRIGLLGKRGELRGCDA